MISNIKIKRLASAFIFSSLVIVFSTVAVRSSYAQQVTSVSGNIFVISGTTFSIKTAQTNTGLGGNNNVIVVDASDAKISNAVGASLVPTNLMIGDYVVARGTLRGNSMKATSVIDYQQGSAGGLKGTNASNGQDYTTVGGQPNSLNVGFKATLNTSGKSNTTGVSGNSNSGSYSSSGGGSIWDFKLVWCDGPALPKIKGITIPDGYVTCDFNGAVDQIQHLITVALYLGVLAAIVLFAFAGYLYVSVTFTGKEEDIKRAHGIFRKVAIGFIIMICGYFIVYQIMSWLGASSAATSLIK